jgi:hypothetical protein
VYSFAAILLLVSPSVGRIFAYVSVRVFVVFPPSLSVTISFREVVFVTFFLKVSGSVDQV